MVPSDTNSHPRTPVRNYVFEQEHYIRGLHLVGQFEHPYGIDNIISGAMTGAKIAEIVKGGN